MKGRQNGGYAKIIEYNFLTDSIDIDIIKKKQMPFLIPMWLLLTIGIGMML